MTRKESEMTHFEAFDPAISLREFGVVVDMRLEGGRDEVPNFVAGLAK